MNRIISLALAVMSIFATSVAYAIELPSDVLRQANISADSLITLHVEYETSYDAVHAAIYRSETLKPLWKSGVKIVTTDIKRTRNFLPDTFESHRKIHAELDGSAGVGSLDQVVEEFTKLGRHRDLKLRWHLTKNGVVIDHVAQLPAPYCEP